MIGSRSLARSGNGESCSISSPLLSECSELKLVALDDIRLHEDHSPQRAKRLADMITLDRKQRHPVVLGTANSMPLLHLDGANRIAALRSLGCEHVAAQVVEYHEGRAVSLGTWSHITRLNASRLLQNRSPIWTVRPLSRADAIAALARGALSAAIVFSSSARSLGVSCPGAVFEKLECLTWLSDCYEVEPVRIASRGLAETSQVEVIAQGHPLANALVIFGDLAKRDVFDVALGGGKLFPPGITRHTIDCGRVLNIDVPLSVLQSKELLTEKWTRVRDLLGARTPRVYHEPTIHFEA